MAQRFNYRVFLTSVLMCLSPLSFAAPLIQPSSNVDEDGHELHSAEVPVESIQQFVQIYNLVKDNYVEAKSDDALFQQAIKGLVSGLDRYSRYLSPEDYKQLVQYTEAIWHLSILLWFTMHEFISGWSVILKKVQIPTS